MKQLLLKNDQLRHYPFLENMFGVPSFPKMLVNKGRSVFINLCVQIESISPDDLDALHEAIQEATELLSRLEDEFAKHGIAVESAAAEAIAHDMYFIAQSYGFEADIEVFISSSLF